MSLAAYQVAVLNPLSGAVKAILDSTALYDLRYSRVLNDIGILAMTLPSTDDLRALFTLDTFIEVYRTDTAGNLVLEETYLARLTHRFIEDNEERFVVGGVSLNHLLLRRVIDPDDDPLVAGGYSTKSGPAGMVMYGYANEQIGPGASVSRRMPGLTVTLAGNIGRPVGARLRHENLLEQLQGFAKTGAVDFQIRRTTGANLELTIGIVGADKTRTTNEPLGQPWVGLSPIRGNLTQPSLLCDRKAEANYCYALGQGQLDRRIVYKKRGVGVDDSPFNRIEFAEDIRNIQRSDVLGLMTGADTALQDRQLKNEFTYEPTGQEPGNIYKIDWDLGDAVTAIWDETELDLRIIDVEVSISAEGETIKATVTDDFIFPSSILAADVTYPKRVTLWHHESTPIVGAAIDSAFTGVEFNIISFQNPQALGDSFTHSFFAAAGSYTVYFLGETLNVGAICAWYCDDVLFASNQDWYGNPGILPFLHTPMPLTIPDDGYHVLRCVVTGRHGLSLGYMIPLTKVWLKQARDA